MALAHPVEIRNEVCDLIVDKVDEGTTNAAGRLVLLSAADDICAELIFSNPAFGDAEDGAAVANPISPDADAAGGTVAKFEIQNRDEDLVLEGTVAPEGADLLGSAEVAPGDIVSIEDGDLVYEAMP